MKRPFRFFTLKTVLSFIVFLSAFKAFSADRYWVGGSGAWNNSAHWSATDGGPGGASTPFTYDNVFFTSNSGFTATVNGTGRTITLPTGATSLARNVHFNVGLATGRPLIVAGAGRLDVYGDYTLEANMTSSWTGALHFYGGTASTSTITTHGVHFNNSLIRFEGDASCNYIITDDFYRIGGNRNFEVDLFSRSNTLTFNGNFFHGGSVQFIKGTVHLRGEFDNRITTGSNGWWKVENNATMHAYENGYTNAFHPNGEVYLASGRYYSFSAVTEVTDPVISGTNPRVFDITGTTMDIRGFWRLGTVTTYPPLTFNAGGSVVTFTETSTYFYQVNLNFNIVNVNSSAQPFEWTASPGATYTQTYNQLNLRANVYIRSSGGGGTPNHTTEVGELNFFPGYRYYADRSLSGGIGARFRFRVTGIINTNAVDCETPVFWDYLRFNFDAGITNNVSNVSSDDIMAVGPDALYSLGVNSVVRGIFTGWQEPLTGARTLIWVGPFQTFDNWYKMGNWRDIAIDPAAEGVGPGFIGGTPTCPPTYLDSVIFLTGSYVRIDKPEAYVNTMEWRGGGIIRGIDATDDALQKLEIWGSLYMHKDVVNDFWKPVWFKSEHANRQIVKTANVPFKDRVIFDSKNQNGSWLIRDTLITVELPAINAVIKEEDQRFVLQIRSGNVHTGIAECTEDPSATIVARSVQLGITTSPPTYSTLHLYNSDMWVLGQGYGQYIVHFRAADENHHTIHPGKSTIYFVDSLYPGGNLTTSNTSIKVPKISLGNKRYNNIVLKHPVGTTYNSYTHFIYGIGATVNNFIAKEGTSPVFINGNFGATAGGLTPVRIKKLDVQSERKAYFVRASGQGNMEFLTANNAKFIIDSLLTKGSIDFNTNIDINAYVEFASGQTYNFGTAAIPTTMTLMGPTTTGPFGGYGSCPGTPNNYPGARAVFPGSCVAKTNINEGFLVVNSPIAPSIDNAIIFNNTASGAYTPVGATNTLMDGTTSGYSALPTQPRTLRWVDGTGNPGNVGDWHNPVYWEQISPVYAPAPQCPPTRIDTALFNNDASLYPVPSFSAFGQKVQITQSEAEIGSMYWDAISGGLSPVFEGTSSTQIFNVYHDVRFHQNMSLEFTGTTRFRGVPSTDFPESSITMNGQTFKNRVSFWADSDDKVWNLQDDLSAMSFSIVGGHNITAERGSFNLMRGSFNTNGNQLNIRMFSAVPFNNSHYRKLDMTNSTINVGVPTTTGGVSYALSGTPPPNAIWVPGTSGNQVQYFDLISTGSTLNFVRNGATDFSMLPGGKEYNNVVFKQFANSGNPGIYEYSTVPSTTVINNLEVRNPTNATVVVRMGQANGNFPVNSIYVKRLVSDITLELYSDGGTYDTIIFNRRALITQNNRFNDYVHFTPGLIYNFGADKVQWFGNNCQVNMIGAPLPIGNLQLYSTVTGQQAYFRKDSAYMCTDFVNMRDIWAIGNGNTCSPQNTVCPHPHPWIENACDTETDHSDDCGPWVGEVITTYNRGRAEFTAGANANNQGNNAGWNYSPYPTPPHIALADYTPYDVCEGETITFPIVIEGALPIIIDATITIEGSEGTVVIDTTYTIIREDGMLTGSGTPSDPYVFVDSIVVPTGATTITISDLHLSVQRCFNNIFSNATPLVISVNEVPSDISANVLPTGMLCPNSIATIGASSTLATTYNIYNQNPGVGIVPVGSYPITSTYTTGQLTRDTIIYVEGVTSEGCKYVNQAIIPIGDIIPPTIICPPNRTVNTNSGSCVAIGVNLGTPTTNDNCEVVSVTNNAPITYPLGETIVEWVITDGAGLTDTCRQIITVIDNQNPTITCPSTVNVFADANSCVATGVNLGTPTTADNCTVTIVTNNAPASFPLGTTVVTWTVTDNSGLTATCTQNVVVTDNQVPTITCPATVNVVTDANSCLATGVNLGTPTTNDNCMVATITNDAPASFPLGITVVTWTVTDNSGLTATCTQNVVVIDNQNPTISCPATVNVVADANSCLATGVNLGTPITSDNCTVATLTNDAPASFPLGITVVTWTVTDNSGLTATCTQNVVVTDNQNPTITCPAIVNVVADVNSCVATGVNLGTPTTNDNCTVTTVTNDAPSSFPLGTTVVTWTVTDNSGLTATCTQNVVVTDNQNPTITCPATVNVVADANSCVATGVNLGTPTTNDNCTVTTVTNDAPASFPLGTTVVTWTVTDNSGLTATCTQNVVVTDNQNPTITCPATVNVIADANSCVATGVNLGTPTTNDNCTVTTVTNDAPASFPLGQTVVTWTVTDNSGLTATCTQNVVVTDNQTPVFVNCPSNQLVSTNADCQFLIPDYTNTVTTDNCTASIDIIVTQTPLSGSIVTGNTTVTLTATDESGNSTTCSFDLTVNDLVSPIARCQDVTVYLNANGVATINTSDIDNGSTDNCSIQLMTLSRSTFNCSDIGSPVTVDLVVWDYNNNSDTCQAIVTILDTLAPDVLCQNMTIYLDENGSASVATADIDNGSTDNCDNNPAMTLSRYNFDCSHLGDNSITLTVTDTYGNSSSCMATVTVVDTIRPTLTCPANVIENPNTINCAATIDIPALSTDDNCSVEIVTWRMTGATTGSSPLTGINSIGNYTFHSGVTTIEYTVTDASGNTASCSFTVTVDDSEAPVISGCPSDITLVNDPGICGAVVTWNITATDNCVIPTITSSHNSGDIFPVGISTVSYTATDAVGNTSTCSFTVTVIDNENPVISITNIDSAVCEGTPVSWTPVTSDNCGIASVVSNYQSGYVFPVGTTTVVYTVRDVNGNSSTESFDVVVNPLPLFEVSTASHEGCSGSLVEFSVINSTSGTTYVWYHNGAEVGTGSNYTIASSELSHSGSYTVVGTNEHGCESDKTIELIVKPCDIIIPEVISPDGNGQNDYFEIENLEEYPGTSVWIHNRWGVEIYHSDNYQNDWDGRSQSKLNVGGDVLPEGTYFYILQLGGVEGQLNYGKVYKGYIYIKR